MIKFRINKKGIRFRIWIWNIGFRKKHPLHKGFFVSNINSDIYRLYTLKIMRKTIVGIVRSLDTHVRTINHIIDTFNISKIKSPADLMKMYAILGKIQEVKNELYSKIVKTL